MTNPFQILFVGVTNDCRSVMAERLLQRQLHQVLGNAAGTVCVSSAGARAAEGAPMDPLAAQEIARLGCRPYEFASRQLTQAMMRQADLVLTMTRTLRSRALEDEPAALRRTFTLREFANLATVMPSVSIPEMFVADAAARRWAVRLDDQDIADPRGARRRHREAAEVIATSCAAVTALWGRRDATRTELAI